MTFAFAYVFHSNLIFVSAVLICQDLPSLIINEHALVFLTTLVKRTCIISVTLRVKYGSIADTLNLHMSSNSQGQVWDCRFIPNRYFHTTTSTMKVSLDKRSYYPTLSADSEGTATRSSYSTENLAKSRNATRSTNNRSFRYNLRLKSPPPRKIVKIVKI